MRAPTKALDPYGAFGHYGHNSTSGDPTMKRVSAKDAKYGFGRLLDSALAEPVIVEKHGRPVVVVLSVEEYERLKEDRNERKDQRKVSDPAA